MNIPQVKNVSSCMNILQVKNVSRCMNIPQIKNVSSCMNIPQVKNVSSCMNIPQVKNVSSCMNIPQVKNVSSCMNIPHLCFHGVDMDNFTVILASYPEKNASLTLYLLWFCDLDDRAELFKSVSHLDPRTEKGPCPQNLYSLRIPFVGKIRKLINTESC